MYASDDYPINRSPTREIDKVALAVCDSRDVGWSYIVDFMRANARERKRVRAYVLSFVRIAIPISRERFGERRA